MANKPPSYWRMIISFSAALFLSSCNKQITPPTEAVLTPSILEKQPTPTPQPPPEWPALIELKQHCDELTQKLRKQKYDEVKAQLSELAQQTKSLATADLPPRVKKPENVQFFQAQLLKLAHSSRLSGKDDEKRLESAEEIRLYVSGIEYAARNMIQQGGFHHPNAKPKP